MNIRVIPRLDIKGPNLVKGIHFEGLRVLGKPERFARYYYEHGADELIYMDVVASLYERNSLHDIITRTSREIFIPLTVGGGLRSIDDIRSVLRAGADKVALNTEAIRRPELIREAARMFGSSTILISIEAKKRPDGSYEAYTDNGRVRTGVNVFEWAVRVAELGAGEILLTSIDREGTGAGYDVEMTRKVAESVPIPVIACGGAGCFEHVGEVIVQGKADAASMASIFHYDCILHQHMDDNYSAEGNITFLKGGREFTKVRGVTLAAIKGHLSQLGVICRPTPKETAYA